MLEEGKKRFRFPTIETRIREPAFVGAWKLKFRLLIPLSNKPKDAETGIG